MADIKIAGVMRAGAYSPNHIGNDAAIFNSTAEQLRKRGCIVNIYSEEQLRASEIHEDVIINMCRERESIVRLQEMEEQGRIVINSGYGIENCTRERMTRLLLNNSIPYPESLIVNTNEAVTSALEEAGFSACWIKRGDFHAMHKEDVSYCRHREEAQEVLKEYYYRGIPRAVINRHLEGDLLKFYGVCDTPFFYWFFPFKSPQAKGAGAEKAPAGFDPEYLKTVCRHAADVLDIKIYGGDAIVSPDGKLRIIDFNDWPSFAPCRNEAAPYIAKCVMSAIKERYNKKI